jgi:hypothetical protein
VITATLCRSDYKQGQVLPLPRRSEAVGVPRFRREEYRLAPRARSGRARKRAGTPAMPETPPQEREQTDENAQVQEGRS